MSNKQAVITPSSSKDYKSANGWFQAKGLHDKYQGAALIIYLKSVGKDKLSLVWYRPTTKLTIKGVGTFLPWRVNWSDKSMSKYTIKKTGSTSTMNVVSCSWKKGCMTNTQAVITPSASKDYKSADGWFQAKGLHDKYKGTALIIYYKNVGKGKLSLVWYRPSTGLKIKGVGTFEG